MSDYSNPGGKALTTSGYPVRMNGSSGLLSRVEPLITPSKLRSRYLKGIFERLPKEFSLSNEELKDRINMAVNELEIELKTPIFAEQFKERHPFDWNLYQTMIYTKSLNRPILSVDRLAIVSSNEANLFTVPGEWIDLGQAHTGQINVIPLLGAFGTNSVGGGTSTGGIVFLSSTLGNLGWVPSYWELLITVGLCKDAGQVPIVVNNLIGVIAAIDILSGSALANPNTSISLSQDGLGQSSSNPGVQIFVGRIAELKEKKMTLLGQLRRITSNKIYVTNI